MGKFGLILMALALTGCQSCDEAHARDAYCNAHGYVFTGLRGPTVWECPTDGAIVSVRHGDPIVWRQ